MSNALDLTGKRFTRLVALHSESRSGRYYWLCKCDCENEKWVRSDCLTTGLTQSCGCLNSENSSNRIKHGDGKRGISIRLYRIWVNMKQRCENKKNTNYKHYGLRGITVCPEWHDYSTFKAWALSSGYTDNLTIDRIDNNGNYEPSNCRWITMKEQTNNMRSNNFITWNGKTKTRTQWAEYFGICPTSIDNYRWKNKCTYEDTICHFAQRRNLQ